MRIFLSIYITIDTRRPFSLSLFLILSNDEFLNESKRNRIVYKMYDILINFDDRATLARSDIGGEYWTLQTGPCSTRPSGMPMVPVLIHCRVVRIYLDAGASVSDAWVGTHADACNLTGRYIFAGWTAEKEKGRRYNRMRRKGEGEEEGRREVTSMPIRAIHISWNTRLLCGTFHLTRYPPFLPNSLSLCYFDRVEIPNNV